MKRFKVFTDDDMDGAGGAIIEILLHGRSNVDIEYGREVNKKIEKLIDTGYYKEYEEIHIIDTSVSESVASKIDALPDNNIYLFDHHPTARKLNKYNWALVLPDRYNSLYAATAHIKHTTTLQERISIIKKFAIAEPLIDGNYNVLISATEIMYILFDSNDENDSSLDFYITCGISHISDLISSYDTYRWKEEHTLDPKYLFNIYNFYGRDKFIDIIVNNILNNEEILNPTNKIIARTIQEKEVNYIKNKLDNVIVIPVKIEDKSFNAGVIFGEKYMSELGNIICSDLNLDLALMINWDRQEVELRSDSDDVDVSKYAKTHNGGGHVRAAGFPLTKEYLKNILDWIYPTIEINNALNSL